MGTTAAPVFGAHFILSRLQESRDSSEALVIPYLGIALTLLAIGIVVWRLSLPAIPTKADPDTSPHAPGSTQKTSIFAFRNLKYGIIALFMYVGAEVSIGTFLTNYISDTLQIAEHQANLYLSLYWGGMLAGRFLGAYFLKFIQASYVLVSVSSLAALLVLISVLSSGQLAVWTMVASGLCNSIMFAVIFSLAVKGLGDKTTRASGLLSTAIVGGAVMSYAQGFLKDHFTWGIAFLVPLICYLFIIFYGLQGYKPRGPLYK